MKKVLFISSTGGHLEELMQLINIFNPSNLFFILNKNCICSTDTNIFFFLPLYLGL